MKVNSVQSNCKKLINRCKINVVINFTILLSLLAVFTQAQNQKDNTGFTVDKGVVLSKKGIPCQPRWFADSRLAFSMEESGIQQVDFWHERGTTVFLHNLWEGFRYYLVKNNLNYKAEYTNSRIWPFGIESEWTFDGVVFKHKVLAVNEAMVFQIQTPEKLPDNYRFKFDFKSAFGLSYADAQDIRFPTQPGRKWKPWVFKKEENIFEGGYYEEGITETDGYTLCTTIGATFPMEYQSDANKHILKLLSPVLKPSTSYSFVVTFGPGASEAIIANNEMTASLDEKISRQYNRYEHIRETMPVLVSPYTELNSYFSLHPMYHEALKITDYPGAIRAKTSNYWVFGWDGFTNNNSTAYWGDTEHIKNMLEFYRKTAHPRFGVLHGVNYDMQSGVPASGPSQGMYLTMLEMYYNMTNDLEELKDKYEFAKKIFKIIADTEVGETGLGKGLSLYPDYMSLILETGNDISSFNNSVFYCAARSMNHLSSVMNDKETIELTGQFIRKMEENYLKLFYDKEKGYVAASLDASTLAQRPVYQSSSFRMENFYLRELSEPILKNVLDFYTKNFVSKAGIRPIPVWGISYSADGNQLHSWWPVCDEFYARLINEFDRKDLIEQYIGYQNYFYRNLTSPEGVSIYVETDEPEFDRWTTLKGAWQAYTSRTWYQTVIHSVVGVDADAGGITFFPYSGEEMQLLGLHYRGKTFDIDMKGSGPFIRYLEVNGKRIEGTNKLPLEYFTGEKHQKITVQRTGEKTVPAFIKYATGVAIKNYSINNGEIKAKLSGAGMGRIYVYAEKATVVKIGGKKVNLSYNEELKQASFVVNLSPGKELSMQIIP